MTKWQNPEFPTSEIHDIQIPQLKYIYFSLHFATILLPRITKFWKLFSLIILKKINVYNLNSQDVHAFGILTYSETQIPCHPQPLQFSCACFTQRSAGEVYRGTVNTSVPCLQAFLSLSGGSAVYIDIICV
jgi:hypothetical protein